MEVEKITLLPEELKESQKDLGIKIAKGVADLIAQYYGITYEDMVKMCRRRGQVNARHVYFYLMCFKQHEIPISLTGIANGVNRRDHSSVIHARNKIFNEIKTNADLKFDVIKIEQLIDKYIKSQEIWKQATER